MTTSTENTETSPERPALRLIVTESPRLSLPRHDETRLATDGGSVVDEFYAGVLDLADRLEADHARILAGPHEEFFKVPVPEGYSEETKGAAFDVLRARGFEVQTSTISSPTVAVYLTAPEKAA